MYSGTTLRPYSGRLVGTHQKIDRIAKRHLDAINKIEFFPSTKQILHFEGKNGPDGVKLKSPRVDEYEHVIDPNDPTDRHILEIISNHIHNLAVALKDKNEVRASFEAAWLAHAVVDGLTPPHHYRLSSDTKTTLLGRGKQKVIEKGKKMMKESSKNHGFLDKWGSWGKNGIVPHVMFELGVASVVTPGAFKTASPSHEEVGSVENQGFLEVYLQNVKAIHKLKMFETFCLKGWNRKLAKQAKDQLMPTMIKMVALAWYQASEDSKKA
jgi:hypothetical protein